PPGQLGDESLDVGHDAVARGCIAVADGRHVPLVHALAPSGHDLAAEADDARRAVEVVERDRARAGGRGLEAIPRDTLHRAPSELGVRLGSGCHRADRETALARASTEVRGSDHALAGAV